MQAHTRAGEVDRQTYLFRGSRIPSEGWQLAWDRKKLRGKYPATRAAYLRLHRRMAHRFREPFYQVLDPQSGYELTDVSAPPGAPRREGAQRKGCKHGLP